MIDSTDETIRRYLTNQLGEEERDAFEERLLDDPDLLETVVAERSLRAGLKAFGDDAVPAQAAARPSLWDRVRRFIEAPGWSYGATALASALAIVVLLPDADPSRVEGARIVDDIVFVGQTRSGDTTVTLIGGRASLLAIDGIRFEAQGQADIQVVRDGKTVEAFAATPLSEEFQFNIIITDLEPGTYSLTVSGAGLEARYQLNVVPEA